MLEIFQDLTHGTVDKSFCRMITPGIEAGHRQHVEMIHRSPSERFDFFGLDLDVPPGIYRPNIDSSSVFTLRAITGCNHGWSQVLELGTGCGAIGLTIVKRGLCSGAWLTDIDPAAVECARSNAQRASLAPVHVLQADLFDTPELPEHSFDAIVFNLPFFHRGCASIEELALTDLNGQLARRFFDQADHYLCPQGEIWFTWSNLSDPAILESARAKWAFELRLAELAPDSGIWKFAYRGTVR